MTGISGTEFVAWALPITIVALVIAVAFLNYYATKIERWGKKHIRNDSKR